MRSRSFPVDAMSSILAVGEVRDPGLDTCIPGEGVGFWYRSADGSRLVASPVLAHLVAESLNELEAAASVFACVPEYRSAWLSILAARLKEYGASRNVRELLAAIGKLGPASRAIRKLLLESRLEATGFNDVELSLFGAPVDQAVAYPRLIRALSSTAMLIEGGQGAAAKSLHDVDPLNPQGCWQQGRLLRLPDLNEPSPKDAHVVLAGTVAPLSE